MYFIYDCNNSVIGNPKGYRTFRGANNQTDGKTKIRNLIWTRFYARENKTDELVCSIKLKETK